MNQNSKENCSLLSIRSHCSLLSIRLISDTNDDKSLILYIYYEKILWQKNRYFFRNIKYCYKMVIVVFKYFETTDVDAVLLLRK